MTSLSRGEGVGPRAQGTAGFAEKAGFFLCHRGDGEKCADGGRKMTELILLASNFWIKLETWASTKQKGYHGGLKRKDT